MVNANLLLKKRPDLEYLLEGINPSGKSLELNVYDLMANSRIDYNKRVQEEINNMYKESDLRSSALSLISKYGHAPAYIFLLNFDQYNESHRKHAFDGIHKGNCIGKHISEESVVPEIMKLAYEDGAVILDRAGFIYAAKVKLVEVNPLAIINSNDEEITHELFGFREEVSTRHYSSIGASFHIKGSVVYTLSEKGHARRFEKGKITFSTIDKENPVNVMNHYVSPAMQNISSIVESAPSAVNYAISLELKRRDGSRDFESINS